MLGPTNHSLPQGFVYAPVYLGKNSVADFSGNGDIEPPPPFPGGSNGPGDDDFSGDSPNSPGIGYFALMALLGSIGIFICKAGYSFCVQLLNENCQKILDLLEKFLGQEQIEETPTPPEESTPTPPEVIVGKASLRAFPPLTVVAAGLVPWSYLLSPETLLRCLNLFFNLSALGVP